MNNVTIGYRPHLINCREAFKYTPKHLEPTKAAACLILFQNFLGAENHSHNPYKSRIDFFKGEGHHPNHVRMVADTNNHQVMLPENTDFTVESLKKHIDGYINRKGISLKVSYLPQVPCSGFVFPAASEEEAVEIRNMLADYDNYLFEQCENMRVDYANMAFIEILDEGEWVSWFKETDDQFYEEDEIEDFIESKKVA